MQNTPFSDYNTETPNLAQYQVQYQKFHQRLEVASSADECLKIIAEWDSFMLELKDWQLLTSIRFHQDTQHPNYIKAKQELEEIYPKFLDLETAFKQALVNSPYKDDLAKNTAPQLFAKWECNIRSFSPDIEKDLSDELKLASKYTSLTASAEINLQGEKLTIPELTKYAEDSDRGIREEAYQARSNWFANNSPELDHIYSDMVTLRHNMAQKLDYPSFVEMGYQRMNRIGYGQKDIETFREEIRKEVVPLCCQLAEQQAQDLGLDTLMFWDNTTFSTNGNPSPLGDHDWMIERATEMFSEMGNGLPELFEQMKSRGVMDLKSRKGKAGGGFCGYLPIYGLPFIFANFNGTRGDVDVFTHEMGHAFQIYSSQNQCVSDLAWPTTEACEIHSMALEFLTWPHMEKFYGDRAEEIRKIHLISKLKFLPYGVTVDHFQHLVYENPTASPEERNAMWQELEKQYLPWYQYGDLPHEHSGRLWQAKQHIYRSPFYYIDYCLALTGAMQFWSKSLNNSDKTLKTYRDLCQLGGSLNYNGLLESAGLNSPFTPGSLQNVISDARAFLNF